MELSDLTIVESPIYQGTNEQVVYTLDTSPWGSTPTSPELIILDKAGADVTASVSTGAFSTVGDVLTLPKIQNLSVSSSPYMLYVRFTTGANRLAPRAQLIAR